MTLVEGWGLDWVWALCLGPRAGDEWEKLTKNNPTMAAKFQKSWIEHP